MNRDVLDRGRAGRALNGTVVHDLMPFIAKNNLQQSEEGCGHVLKVGCTPQAGSRLDPTKDLHAE